MPNPPKTPAEVLRALEALKSSLLNAPHDPITQRGGFHEIMGAFLDLAMVPIFLRLSSPCECHKLDSLLEVVCRQIGRKDSADAGWLRVRGSSFVHGGIAHPHRPLTVFYFEDVDVGAAAWMTGNGETIVVRLSAIPADDDLPPLGGGPLAQA